jgi:uncharacterized membrane protein YebE (DUF533 family)
MADLNKLLGQLLGSGAAGGFAGGLAGGLASNMLTTKKGRKLGKKALKMGGIAAVGAMAYGAYQRYSNKSAPSQQTTAPQSITQTSAPQLQPAPEGSAFMPPKNDSVGQQQLGLTLVRAMIAAARSDGTLDAQESQAIFQRIEALGLAQAERDLLIEEMGRPVNIDAIVSQATTQELATEIYIASLLAIDVDTVEEQSYLAMLAARLKLPPALVMELHNQVEAQTVPVTV